jgi:predicted ArsR family transcriptional regulator
VHEAVSRIAVLDDPQRARLYRLARASSAPITREEAASELGISRKLAAFHLDRLVESGLLEVSFERPSGAGVRIGRTPKRYRATAVELEISVPERHYDLVGEILLDAVEQSAPGEEAAEVAERVARDRGWALGAALRAERRLGRLGPERAQTILTELLGDLGFEPAAGPDGIVPRNCPFHRLAQRSPALVCGINLGFIAGIVQGLEATRVAVALEPAEGRCCVVLRTT